MKHLSVISALLVLPLASPVSAALEGELPFDIYNRLRVEYDDNIRQNQNDPDDSIKIIEDIEILKGMDFGNSRLNIRYNPSFTWWSDRDEDETDLHHELEAGLYHQFDEKTWLSLKETFRIAQYPELIADEGETSVILRENSDYLYNSIVAGLGTSLSAQLTASGSLRYLTLGYDDDSLASRLDYDKLVAGVDIGYLLNPQNTVSAEVRFSDTDYETEARSSESLQYGGALRSLVGPHTTASARAGFETKSYDADGVEDSDSPYFDASLETRLAEATRVVLGVGYSQDESPIDAYANQERTSVRAGVTQDLTGRLQLALSGLYSQGSYDAAERVVDTPNAGDPNGDEAYFRISSLLSYQLNNRNSLQFSWQYLDLTSDVRPGADYDRNRVSIGWKSRL